MKNNFQSKFDALSIALLLFIFFGSICFTSIVKHVLLYFIPVLFIAKKLLFRTSFLKDVCYRNNPLLSLIALSLFVIPPIMGLIHGDFDLSQVIQLQWINHYNSWLILYAYLATSYFLYIKKEIKLSYLEGFRASLLGLIIFLLAFAVDFLYSLVKWFSHGFTVERWQGSSGNPQLWAVQASLMLVVWIIIHKDLDNLFKSKNHSMLILGLLIASTILTGSISNFIGLAFASLAWFLPWAWLSLFIVFAYVIVVNFWTWSFLINYQGDVQDLKNIFQGLSNKFIPRLKLWLELLRESPNLEMDYLSGLGLNAYNDFLDKATLSKHENVHSLYLHNWLISGITGVYITFIFLTSAMQKILQNKYYLSICLYVLSASVFDCALNFLEVQIVFWLILPLIVDRLEQQ